MPRRTRLSSGALPAVDTPADVATADVTTAVLLAQNDLAIRMAMLALASRTNPVKVGRVLSLLDELARLVDQCEQDLLATLLCC